MAWRVSWTLTVSGGNAVKPMLRKLPPGSVAKLHSMLHAVEHAVQVGGSNPAAALNPALTWYCCPGKGAAGSPSGRIRSPQHRHRATPRQPCRPASCRNLCDGLSRPRAGSCQPCRRRHPHHYLQATSSDRGLLCSLAGCWLPLECCATQYTGCGLCQSARRTAG